MIRWKTGDEIGGRGRLKQLLRVLEDQAEREGIPFEVVSLEVRREAAERNRRKLAALEAEDG